MNEYDLKFVHIWAVIINSDGTEGRGPNVIYCYCDSKQDADIISYGKDVMGSRGKVEKVLALNSKNSKYYSLNQRIGTNSIAPITLRRPTSEEIQSKEDILFKSIRNKLTPDELRIVNSYGELV